MVKYESNPYVWTPKKRTGVDQPSKKGQSSAPPSGQTKRPMFPKFGALVQLAKLYGSERNSAAQLQTLSRYWRSNFFLKPEVEKKLTRRGALKKIRGVGVDVGYVPAKFGKSLLVGFRKIVFSLFVQMAEKNP